MPTSDDLKEALLSEAVGELIRLMDRMDAVVAGTDSVRGALLDAQMDLTRQLDAFEHRMKEVSSIARTKVVEHITTKSEQAMKSILQRHVEAMQEATREAHARELGAAVHQLRMTLQHVTHLADWRRSWPTHAAAALAGAVLATAVMGAVWLW
jgi:hypothetical protein